MFNKPEQEIEAENYFGDNEVGLNHPDVPGFIRIAQNGDIQLVADGGLSIIMSPKSGSITFVADHIKFMTKHDNGLRWNRVAFNDQATTFNEPTFIQIDDAKEGYGMYQGIEHFIDKPDNPVRRQPKREDC